MIQLYAVPVLAGFVLTLLLLIVFHLLWNDTPEEVRYLLGGGAICAGCGLAGLIADDGLMTVGPLLIASAGLAIVLWQWLERRTARHHTAAERRGEITGMAKGLLDELKDRKN